MLRPESIALSGRVSCCDAVKSTAGQPLIRPVNGIKKEMNLG